MVFMKKLILIVTILLLNTYADTNTFLNTEANQKDNKCQKFLDKADQVYNILGNMKIDGMVGYKEASQKTQGLAIYADSLLKRYKLCKEIGK